MIFSALGSSVRRFSYLWLAGWVLLLLVTWYYAPPWDSVAVDRDFEFLPPTAPSRQAEEVFKKAFPNERLGSSIVLVLHRADDSPAQLKQDKDFIFKFVEARLRAIAKEEQGEANDGSDFPSKKTSIIASIDTPNAPVKGDLLVSADQKVLLVILNLTTEFMVKENWPTIERVENLIRELKEEKKLPPGTDLTLTGSAVIGRDHTIAELQSAKATTWLTVIFVVVLLILIYRAPLLAVIPLSTVYLSVQLSLNLLAILSKAGTITIIPGHPLGITLFQGMQIYITILAYGAGIDYCLFLTARYKEELDRGCAPPDAIARAVGDVGGALCASAATVICGIGMMAFAQFGKFQQAGLAIPIVLLLVLGATLTFSPALLQVAGPWAFWPHRLKKIDPTKPIPEPEATAAGGFVMGELSLIWQRVGAMLLRRPGLIWLVTVGLMTPFAIYAGLNYNRLSYDMIGNLPADSPSVAGTQVLVKHFSPGIVGPTTIVLTNNRDVDFRSGEGEAAIAQITERLSADRKELGLYDVRSYTAPLGVTGHFVLDREKRVEINKQYPYTRFLNEERKHRATRFVIVLQDNPFAQTGFHDLDRIQETIKTALPANMRDGTTISVVGTTASVRDLSMVMKEDRTRIELLVLSSVFLILMVLLRRLLVTLYLLVSVLFSYYVTLGVTIALFYALDPSGFTGIDWKVAIFLFTILIAVGEDYNIFLITRIHEEDRRYKPLEAITHALTRTGPIISSCGLIMAGTFASLLAGSLSEMKQLGFALTFGVLLDTFVVRPILVPSFLILLRSGRLSPAGWFRRSGAVKKTDVDKHHVKPRVEEPAG